MEFTIRQLFFVPILATYMGYILLKKQSFLSPRLFPTFSSGFFPLLIVIMTPSNDSLCQTQNLRFGEFWISITEFLRENHVLFSFEYL